MGSIAQENESFKGQYRTYVLRKILFILLFLTLVFFCSGVSLTLGGRDIGFFESFKLIIDHILGNTYETGSEIWWDDFVLWTVRLPRILTAVVVGAALSVCGTVIQSIVKNPLADPYTAGISSGAVFGVSVAMSMGFVIVQGSGGDAGSILNAFIFGLIPAGVIIAVSRFRNSTSATIILAGIAMSYLFSALSTLIMITSSAETLQSIYLWQIGSLERATWSTLPFMTLVTAIDTIVCMLVSNKLNVLSSGENTARSLGLDTDGLKTLCLVVTAFMTAAVVSYVGIIGFLGLVAPNIVRLVLGSDNRFIIPASILVGASFLVLADTLSRLIVTANIPVGVVMSLIGGPIFLAIILLNKRGI